MDLIEEFRKDLLTRGLSKYTVSAYPRYVRAFERFAGGDLLAVDQDALIDYIEFLRGNKLTLSSMMRYFSAIAVFYDFLVWKKIVSVNPVSHTFRKRYLREYKSHTKSQQRKCLTVAEAKRLVESVLTIREKAVIVTFLKTGIRRSELSNIDIEDLDMENMTIHLKDTAKRSNEIVYFDAETSKVLERWLSRREKLAKGTQALFLDSLGHRFSPDQIAVMVVKYATAIGLHKPDSPRLEDKLTPHCFRHFFTSQLLENHCPREYVMELRGDSRREAVDIYNHIDKKLLKESYLSSIPQLGL